MQCSIVDYTEVDLGDRIDAEYFQPTYRHIEETLVENHAIPLRNYCSITGSAFYPAATHLYEAGDLPFIRCVDCISYPIITSRQNTLFEKVPRDFADEHKNIKRLSKGEIVLTKVGTPCYASIIHDLEDVALSRTVLGLKSITNIDPYYLVVFLRSKYGFLQLFRERELTIQFQLTFDRVGNVLIFKPADNKLESQISNCFVFHEASKERSEQLYNQAQTLLLSELRLNNWQPKHAPTFVKNHSDTEQAGRIDADYFQPFYEEVNHKLQSTGVVFAKDICSQINYGTVPTSPYSEDNTGVPYIKGLNLKNLQVNTEKLDYISNTNALPDKVYTKAGDIIISQMGTVGNCAVVSKEQENWVFASFTIRIRIAEKSKYDPYYVALYIENIAKPYYLMRNIAQASVRKNTDLPTIKQMPIPSLSFEKQQQISQTITESFDLRQQSKHLLDCAKRAVEIAIDRDEQTAIEWLDSATKGLLH